MLLVTIVFANNFLNARMAENEFKAVKQFMQTVGLQVDDVAWTIGRAQTIRYASKFGQVNFESLALNYTIYVNKGSGYVLFANYTVGILLFNMPIERYSVGNGYFEPVFPSSNTSFLQKGASAPICYVYVIEKLPMDDGNFIRVVVVPSIRMLNSQIPKGTQNENRTKLYLPKLSPGDNPRNSQSVTLTGRSVLFNSTEGCKAIKVRIEFPKASLGFDADFFKFDKLEEIEDIPDGFLEVFVGEVSVSLGLHP